MAMKTPLPRMPLEEFVKDARLLNALRKGVKAMKARRASDPLSWFFQSAIHGVTPDAITCAATGDPEVNKVDQKKYWNQCPHFGQNSANFLPWHRGYTYYFEKILRMHTGEDDFSLPYWNYTEKANRKFPLEFGIQHLDGNQKNDDPDNINPLYLESRDFYFCGYEHPFATGLPLLELADSAVDISLSMGSPVFFGETESEGLGGGIADNDPSTRGLLESYPHDQIHRVVGGIVVSPTGQETDGAMATPPTAAFDPIFSIHHSNIDRLWAVWSCMAGKSWGKIPPRAWFEERPWFFFDVDGKEVNRPRREYFDYRALGIRFKYEDPSAQPLPLPDMGELGTQPIESMIMTPRSIGSHATSIAALGAVPSVVPLSEEAHRSLAQPLRPSLSIQPTAGRQRLLLRLLNVDIGTMPGVGFDIHVTRDPAGALVRSSASFVGTINLFPHKHGPGMGAVMGMNMAAARGGAGSMPAMNMAHHGGAGSMPGMNMGQAGGPGESATFDVTDALAALSYSELSGISIILVPYSLVSAGGASAMSLRPQALKSDGYELLTV